MTVAAVKPYVGEPRDALANFHGNQLLFVAWDKHLMFAGPFAFPVPPSMSFGSFVREVLAGPMAIHPDAAQLDWDKAQWKKDGKPWKPDMAKSLAENGLVHKDFLRLVTPGLDGIRGLGI